MVTVVSFYRLSDVSDGFQDGNHRADDHVYHESECMGIAAPASRSLSSLEDAFKPSKRAFVSIDVQR